jgi:hypothetical protein
MRDEVTVWYTHQGRTVHSDSLRLLVRAQVATCIDAIRARMENMSGKTEREKVCSHTLHSVSLMFVCFCGTSGVRYGQRRTNATYYARRGFHLCADQHCNEPLPAHARSRLIHALVLVLCSRSQKETLVLRYRYPVSPLCVHMLYNYSPVTLRPWLQVSWARMSASKGLHCTTQVREQRIGLWRTQRRKGKISTVSIRIMMGN